MVFLNKQKVLLVSSRGVGHRQRHLLTDLASMLPHTKKDAKLDTKKTSLMSSLMELCDLNDCSSALYFDVRGRGEDVYLWMTNISMGPSIKFLTQNVHTLDEMVLSGNCLKGSRPIISLDATFDSQPHWKLIKEMLTQVFAVPPRHRKSKPFIDHVLSMSIIDDRIWIRHYQIVESADTNLPLEERTFVEEIGPRFTLLPIRIFDGICGGRTLWENKEFVAPTEVRRAKRKADSIRYIDRVSQSKKTRKNKMEATLPPDELHDVFN